MAYRRLPNTDNARLLAILKLNELLNDGDLVLKNYREKIIDYKSIFEKLIEKRDSYNAKKRTLNKQKKELLLRLKIYVSHFLQVFNFAIDRGDIDKECRKFFELRTNTGVIPSLSKETDIIKWAYRIVIGEQKRIVKGAEVISHPHYTQIQKIAIATDKVIADLKIIDDLFKAYQEEIAEQRVVVDDFIKQLWNEIEYQFINETIAIKRKKATRYGVVYVE
jgi:hypothetical protein